MNEVIEYLKSEGFELKLDDTKGGYRQLIFERKSNKSQWTRCTNYCPT
jgi:hypothetical protein